MYQENTRRCTRKSVPRWNVLLVLLIDHNCKSSKQSSPPLDMPESNPTYDIPMDPQPTPPSTDYFPPGSQKPKRYNKYGDEIFED